MRLVDLSGQRFGRLVVLSRAGNRGARTVWLCRCDCGAQREVHATALRRSTRPTRSCGCLYDERRIDRTSGTPACQRPANGGTEARTGTKAGYLAHRYVGEEACGPCMEGAAQEQAAKRVADPLAVLRDNLWRKYRLTVEAYEAMLAAQDGRCAICRVGAPRDIRTGRFHVDHDHSCCPGKTSCGACVRGLLCHACNTALGNFADDRARLQRAIDYLDRRRREPLLEAVGGRAAHTSQGGGPGAPGR